MNLSVNTADRLPLYQQLARQIREAIARGEVRPDEGLPSVRQLSQRLVINPNTVARAYGELEREGLLVSQPGRGVFVAPPRREPPSTAGDRRLVEQLDRWLTEAVHLGYTAEQTLELVATRVREFRWTTDGAA
jgi:GntR family transcriptional regulator